MVKRIAITGNIAAGKSTVEKIIAAKGYTVLDADKLAHEILEQSEEVRLEFKNYDIFEDGKVSRTKLGHLVFADTGLKKKLEDIIHPELIEKIKSITTSPVFIAVPILFEAGMEKLFDKVILVHADDDIRLERLIKRNNYSIEHAKQRMASQMPQDEKIKRSDYVIRNNGEDLEEQVDKILRELQLL